jgi:hypothetical protein
MDVSNASTHRCPCLATAAGALGWRAISSCALAAPSFHRTLWVLWEPWPLRALACAIHSTIARAGSGHTHTHCSTEPDRGRANATWGVLP